MAVDDLAGFVFFTAFDLPPLENASIGVNAHAITPAAVYAYPHPSVLRAASILVAAVADTHLNDTRVWLTQRIVRHGL